ncbi:MAG: hypothetical protein RIQ72_249 [Candidatus Parcubacteria bacterium]
MCSALFLFVAVMAILESVFQFETRFYDSTTRALMLPWDLTGPLAEKRLLAAVCLLLFGCFVSCIADISDIKQGNFTIAGAVNTITSIGSVIICPTAGAPMQAVQSVRALAGLGLEGDRYATATGSFNRGKPGNRQVTLINGIFFPGSGLEYRDSRRNIITQDVELMWLIGREFQVGTSTFRGVKYCDPCNRPSSLAQRERNFKDAFFDRGGLIAEVVIEGVIAIDSPIILPPKGY